MNGYDVCERRARSGAGSRAAAGACLLFTAFLLFASPCWGFRNLKVGVAVQNFVLQDLDGARVSLSDFSGKAVLVCYWRMNQDRSTEALKQLKILSEDFSGKPLQILAITKDAGQKSAIKELKRSLELPYPVLIDEDARVYTEFGVFVFPVTALFDATGVYRYHYGGLRDDYRDELSGQIRLLLGLVTPEQLAEEKSKKFSTMTEQQRKAIHHLNLGRKLKDRGLYEKALEEFQKAVDLEPDNFDANIELGFSLLDRDDIDAALVCFEKASQLNPRSADAKIGLGSVYRIQGRTEEAVKILKSGMLLCPNSARIHLELGRIYEAAGNKDEALKHYKEAAECILVFKKTKRY